MEGKDGKTESATPKKRKEEREKGNVCTSQEVITVITLIVGFLALRMFVPLFYEESRSSMASAFAFERLGTWTGPYLATWFASSMVSLGKLMSLLLVPVVLAGVISSLVQTGPMYSPEAMELKFGSLNPLNGLKSLFSAHSVVNMVLSILKVALVVYVAYMVFSEKAMTILGLANVPVGAAAAWMFSTIFTLTMKVMTVFAVVAVLDWWFRWYKFEKSIMMTKQEVHDETKQQDVNPVVKKAQHKKFRELSLLRMMSEVPNATVVVTNPTHVAIAIQYDPEKMAAPRVVAKGLRLVAERIKRIARENNVPVIEKPELARALYKHVRVGSEIPSKFYEAVASVLAYLHKIGRGLAGSYAK